jgi:hypothetical protein
MTMTETPIRQKPTVAPEFANAVATLDTDRLRPALDRMPISTDGLEFTLLRVIAKTNFDRTPAAFESGVPKLSADIEVGRDGFGSSPVKVNLAEDFCRRFLTTDSNKFGTAKMPVEITGFSVGAWSVGDKNGISFSAESLAPVKTVSVPAAPAPKGDTAKA